MMVCARPYNTVFAKAFYILEYGEEEVYACFVDPQERVKTGRFPHSALRVFELDEHFTPRDMTKEDMVAYEWRFWGAGETRRRKARCPLCGGKDFIPVGYGLPTEKAVQMAREGEGKLPLSERIKVLFWMSYPVDFYFCPGK